MCVKIVGVQKNILIQYNKISILKLRLMYTNDIKELLMR